MKQQCKYFLISILLLYGLTTCGETAMRMFKQNKLWRDKLIEMMEKNYDSRIHWRLLDDAEFDREIRVKLKEEADEVATAHNRKTLVEELADLYEVIDTLSALHAITKDEIIAVQTKKKTLEVALCLEDLLKQQSTQSAVLVRNIVLLIL